MLLASIELIVDPPMQPRDFTFDGRQPLFDSAHRPSPHPLSRSRIYPTSATLKCRTRVNPSSGVKDGERERTAVPAKMQTTRTTFHSLSPLAGRGWGEGRLLCFDQFKES